MINLKFMRMDKHLSQTELAKELGVTNQAISNIETGRSKPGKNLAKKLGAFFDVDWRMFL